MTPNSSFLLATFFITAISFANAATSPSNPPSCLSQNAWQQICITLDGDAACGPYNGTRYELDLSTEIDEFYVLILLLKSVHGTIATASITEMLTLATALETKAISIRLILKVLITCTLKAAAAFAIPPVRIAEVSMYLRLRLHLSQRILHCDCLLIVHPQAQVQGLLRLLRLRPLDPASLSLGVV